MTPKPLSFELFGTVGGNDGLSDAASLALNVSRPVRGERPVTEPSVQRLDRSGRTIAIGDDLPPAAAPAVVPEPSSLLLLGSGGLGIILGRRRRT